MTEASLEQETASPLLLELARALRARQFYPPTHPTLKATLERTLAVWHEGLSKVEELRLELRGGSLLLPDGTPASGPGIDDVAKALRLRRVRRLRVHCDLEAQELLVLIDALAQNAESLEQLGGLEQSLLRAGVRHITTSEMEFAELSNRAQLPVQPPPTDDPDDDTDPAPQGAHEVARRAGRRASPADHPQGTPEKQRSESISELIQLLTELEKCDQGGEYQELATRIQERVVAMTEAGNAADGYRAVLVCWRHATDPGARTPELRAEAERWLHQLAESPHMLDLVIDHACSSTGLSSVQATQTLICLGSSVVPTLLARYENGSNIVQSQLTAVLIAMGETAFPVMVREVASDSPERARQAARLLGRMQNPRATDALLERLQEPDNDLQQEAARGLARIGTEHALQGLLQAANKLPELTSVVIASLGEARSPSAVQALAQMLDTNSRYSENEQREAIRSLGRIRNPEALAPLKHVLGRKTFLRRKRTRALRIAAARALGRIGGDDASMALAEHAVGPDPALRKACHESLERMSRAETR
ncbi:MAG: HEAT repeat domain-containing protein [Myxococcales bacterium]|nr:HEAT repeat domain-containing protein [Myxococcales bacterium]